jgi:hypothetical protein
MPWLPCHCVIHSAETGSCASFSQHTIGPEDRLPSTLECKSAILSCQAVITQKWCGVERAVEAAFAMVDVLLALPNDSAWDGASGSGRHGVIGWRACKGRGKKSWWKPAESSRTSNMKRASPAAARFAARWTWLSDARQECASTADPPSRQKAPRGERIGAVLDQRAVRADLSQIGAEAVVVGVSRFIWT